MILLVPIITPASHHPPQPQLINNISDDNYINQPISKAAPPPADVNYTLTVVRPLQPNSPQNFNSFGFRVDNGTDISFARDPHAPSLLLKDMQVGIFSNAPHTYHAGVVTSNVPHRVPPLHLITAVEGRHSSLNPSLTHLFFIITSGPLLPYRSRVYIKCNVFCLKCNVFC